MRLEQHEEELTKAVKMKNIHMNYFQQQDRKL